MTVDPSRALRFCPSSELPEGGAKSRLLDGVPVGVARLGGRVAAFGALCPHQQADLTEGIVEDGGITCPAHLWHFDLSSGACGMVPGAQVPIYRAHEEDGWILVELTP